MPKTRVIFAPSPSVYKNILENQIPHSLESKFECTDDFKRSDIVVMWDSTPHHIERKIKNKKLIYIGAEPSHIKNQSKINEDIFMATFNYPAYVSDYLPAIWWINRSYKDLVNLKFEDVDKHKKISCVVSNKWTKRTKFVKMIASEVDKMEVWGRWIYNKQDDDFTSSDQFKGSLNGPSGASCKAKGIEGYSYSLCLENASIRNYWTEKIIDSFLCWTMPIYYGATNIYDFFPENSVYAIDMKRTAVSKIKQIIECPPTSRQVDAMREARRRILDEYNIWSVINKLINR